MYVHVVFWNLKEDINGTKKEVLSASLLERIKSLTKQIPGIIEIQTGKNIGDYNATFYDICFITKFICKEDFINYTKHESHDVFLKYVRPVLGDEQIVDFEL